MNSNTLLDIFQPVFYPKSIAVIGASQIERKGSNRWIGKLIKAGYKGTIYPVSTSGGKIHGLKVYKNVELRVGNAEKLPFKDNMFDIVTCNLLLMWAENPQMVVKEMARVTKTGGIVLASLEPDYGGKLHWPENPKIDPIFAGKAIKDRGGDPHIGRKLRLLFVRAGLITKVGIGNNRIWNCEEDKAYYLHARDFYVKTLKDAGLSQDEIDRWEYDYLESLDEGIQLNFFPQFYAIGKKP